MQELVLMREHFGLMAEKLRKALLLVGKQVVAQKLTVHIVQPDVRINGARMDPVDVCREQVNRIMSEVATVFWSDPEMSVLAEIKEQTKEIVTMLVDDIKRHLAIPMDERMGRDILTKEDSLFADHHEDTLLKK